MKTLVAILLVALEPLHFAGELLMVLPTLVYRGWVAFLEVAVHAGVAALCVMAGFALINGSPDARRVATIAILASMLRVVQSTYWSSLPNDTIPGDEPLSIAVSVAAAGVALFILRRR